MGQVQASVDMQDTTAWLLPDVGNCTERAVQRSIVLTGYTEHERILCFQKL